MFKHFKNIHFVGIGGSGMNGIAEVLHNDGYNITGSDLLSTPVTARLEGLGIKIFIGHSSENIEGVNVVVCSSRFHSQIQK